MANFYAQGRSNYFRVSDSGRFEAFCDKYRLEYWTRETEGTYIKSPEENPKKELHYAFTSRDEGGLCTDPEPDEFFDIEKFVEELSSILAEGEVAIYQEVGNEKLRYLSGWSLAIHSSGKAVEVGIQDIYQKAKEAFGLHKDCVLSDCSY